MANGTKRAEELIRTNDWQHNPPYILSSEAANTCWKCPAIARHMTVNKITAPGICSDWNLLLRRDHTIDPDSDKVEKGGHPGPRGSSGLAVGGR